MLFIGLGLFGSMVLGRLFGMVWIHSTLARRSTTLPPCFLFLSPLPPLDAVLACPPPAPVPRDGWMYVCMLQVTDASNHLGFWPGLALPNLALPRGWLGCVWPSRLSCSPPVVPFRPWGPSTPSNCSLSRRPPTPQLLRPFVCSYVRSCFLPSAHRWNGDGVSGVRGMLATLT